MWPQTYRLSRGKWWRGTSAVDVNVFGERGPSPPFPLEHARRT